MAEIIEVGVDNGEEEVSRGGSGYVWMFYVQVLEVSVG